MIDPLASFLPGRCESDAATLLEALQPLHRLTAAGIAVLLLHHPRKAKSEAGSSARGSGTLLGFVDCSLELTRYSRLGTRRGGTPARLAYEWNPASGTFAVCTDPRERQFEEHWHTVLCILKDRKAGTVFVDVIFFEMDDNGKIGSARC